MIHKLFSFFAALFGRRPAEPSANPEDPMSVFAALPTILAHVKSLAAFAASEKARVDALIADVEAVKAKLGAAETGAPDAVNAIEAAVADLGVQITALVGDVAAHA